MSSENNLERPSYPASAALKTFKNKVTSDINNSGLPAWMLLDALIVITNEVKRVSEEMTEKETFEYNQAMAEYLEQSENKETD